MTPAPIGSGTLLEEGRAALLAGDKARAQTLLQQAVEHDPHSEDAWIWFSAVQTTPHAMAECLQRVLAINPHNEQAQEGLQWLETTHGPLDQTTASGDPSIAVVTPDRSTAASDPPIANVSTPAGVQPATAAATPRRRTDGRSSGLLIEALLHPFAVGALLGLIRLAGWLRPETLVLHRSAGELGYGAALGVGAAAAVLHGGALLTGAVVLGWLFSRARSDGRGDVFDSLVRVGSSFTPGYVWIAALVAVSVGVRLGADVWLAIAALCWTILLGGTVLIVRQLRRQLQQTSPLDPIGSGALARLLVVPLIVMIVLLAGAGLVTAAVLG